MLKQGQAQKQTARLSMKLWLPILESSLSELTKNIDEMSQTNPYVQVKKGLENEFKLRSKDIKKFQGSKSSGLDEGSAASISKEESLYDKLLSQIEAPMFPTQISQKVAKAIVENLDENGFFDGDIKTIAAECKVEEEYAEKIRSRFAGIEPCGIGAKDVKEALYFQLCALDVEEDVYMAIKALIYEKDTAMKSLPTATLRNAKKILSRLKTVPAIDYQESSAPIIPDVAIVFEKDKFEVRLNALYR